MLLLFSELWTKKKKRDLANFLIYMTFGITFSFFSKTLKQVIYHINEIKAKIKHKVVYKLIYDKL